MKCDWLTKSEQKKIIEDCREANIISLTLILIKLVVGIVKKSKADN